MSELDPDPVAPRRTQQERREATISKLLDATIETITEVGYARTSVKEICDRAGVSHGGLFRHYPTRLDLVVAAAQEVSRRQLVAFKEQFTSLPLPDETLLSALRLLRDAVRTPTNMVWTELLVAARTDDELRARIEPVSRRYFTNILDLAMSLPFAVDTPREIVDLGIRIAVHYLDGENLRANVVSEPDEEDLALVALAFLFERGPSSLDDLS
jgi:AcrR family transcriptional regulator